MIWQAVRCPPVRIDQSCWNLEQHSKLVLMVCFILQSPPHIDREPVSFITPGSCPPFQSGHTTDLCSPREREQIGPGAPTASSGLHPTSQSRGGFPFWGVKITRKASPPQTPPAPTVHREFFSDLIKIHLLSMWTIKWLGSAFTESPVWTDCVYGSGSCVSLFNAVRGHVKRKKKKERERKKGPMPLSCSVGK